jgi:hypothetical protein
MKTKSKGVWCWTDPNINLIRRFHRLTQIKTGGKPESQETVG